MDVPQRYPPFFTIIKPIVNCFNGRVPRKILSYRKINAMPNKIGCPFTFIPFVSHCKCDTLLYIQFNAMSIRITAPASPLLLLPG